MPLGGLWRVSIMQRDTLVDLGLGWALLSPQSACWRKGSGDLPIDMPTWPVALLVQPKTPTVAGAGMEPPGRTDR